MEMTEEQKKEAKTKAAGSKAEARRAGAAGPGSAELVVVNLSCTAPDKVVVSLDFPALSAPA